MCERKPAKEKLIVTYKCTKCKEQSCSLKIIGEVDQFKPIQHCPARKQFSCWVKIDIDSAE